MKIAVASGRDLFADEIREARRLGFQLQVAQTPIETGGLLIQARATPTTAHARTACAQAQPDATAIEAQALAASATEGLDVARECIRVVLERAKDIA